MSYFVIVFVCLYLRGSICSCSSLKFVMCFCVAMSRKCYREVVGKCWGKGRGGGEMFWLEIEK